MSIPPPVADFCFPAEEGVDVPLARVLFFCSPTLAALLKMGVAVVDGFDEVAADLLMEAATAEGVGLLVEPTLVREGDAAAEEDPAAVSGRGSSLLFDGAGSGAVVVEVEVEGLRDFLSAGVLEAESFCLGFVEVEGLGESRATFSVASETVVESFDFLVVG